MILSGTDPRVRRKRTRRRSSSSTATAGTGAAVLVGVLVLVYGVFLYQSESVLDKALNRNVGENAALLLLRKKKKSATAAIRDPSGSSLRKSPRHEEDELLKRPAIAAREGSSSTINNDSNEDKFLIFLSQLPGQGTGNVISGLLAAHLLGAEFNRTVCVAEYDDFTTAFEPVDPNIVTKCPGVQQNLPNPTSENTVHLINYFSPPNECVLQERLASSQHRILYLIGNTYPRWPSVPDNFFLHFYQPRQVLLDMLPYDQQPTTVVHLREPDNPKQDFRKGLDEASLTALGEMLPSGDTYLVTNRVSYYERFEKCCQWSHPDLDTVLHSATSKQWGSRNDQKQVVQSKEKQKHDNLLHMWVDWYTILMAKTVYHTFSDFSISAIHWMNNRDSHCIEGMKNGKLQTNPESWWIDGETASLVERTRDAEGTSRLRLCT